MSSQRGFSIAEVLVTLGMASIMMAYALPNLLVLNDPMQNGLSQVAGFMKQARARAMVTTSAYTVMPLDNSRIITRYSNRCDDPLGDTEEDTKLVLDLPEKVTLMDTLWSICFSARGLSDNAASIYLQGPNFDYHSVEVFLGGLVRVSEI